MRVYGRIGQMALEYDESRRDSVLAAVGALDAQAIADAKTGYVMQLEPRKHKLVMDLADEWGIYIIGETGAHGSGGQATPDRILCDYYFSDSLKALTIAVIHSSAAVLFAS
mgnify:CR=1 FL=1